MSAERTEQGRRRVALVSLRTALEAIQVAEMACMAADLGNVYVLDPLETAHRDLAAAVGALAQIVMDGGQR